MTSEIWSSIFVRRRCMRFILKHPHFPWLSSRPPPHARQESVALYSPANCTAYNQFTARILSARTEYGML